MDITNILNRKGSAAAAAIAAAAAAAASTPEQHFHQQLAQVSTRLPSDSDSELLASPYGSDSSRYMPRHNQGMQPMTNIPDGFQYPSPTAMQAQLPMLQNGLMAQGSFDNGYAQDDLQGSGRPALGSPTHKAFPCSSCGKGFARRSDLARHGQWSWSCSCLTSCSRPLQRESIPACVLMCAIIQDVTSSSSSDLH